MTKIHQLIGNGLQFLQTPPDPSQIYETSYNSVWITISVLLAILASYAAFQASKRIAYQHDFRSKLSWIAISALTMGAGIWGMHFIGMLALDLSCDIYYDPLTTLISMIPGVLASGVALGVVKRHGARRLSTLTRSILLGAGIGIMHYTGMASMQMEGVVRYNPALFALSIFVAIALSYLALFVKNRPIPLIKRSDALVAIIMGAAVSGMHYTAIAAAYFVRGDAVSKKISSVINTDILAILIVVIAVFLALTALALAAMSRNREMTSQLRESEERWKFALESSGDGVWDWNLQTDESLYSRRWKEMIGYAEDEFQNKGSAWIEHLHCEDKDRVLSAFKDYLTGAQPVYTAEFRMCCKDGSWKWILSRGKLVNHDANGNPLRMIGTHTDISDRKQAEIAFKIAAIAFESQEGMMITDANKVILRVNHAFTEITGYTAEELIGKTPSILKSGHHNAAFYSAMWDSLLSKGVWEGEIWNRRKDDKIFPQHLSITAVKNTEGAVTNFVSTITDITMSKAAADEIEHLAFYDSLTGLPNRQLLRDRLKLALASSDRSKRKGSLLMIDMDNFKTLNDTLGHGIGDLLLEHVAKRLCSCLREGDTVARLGGDEFVVILENLNENILEVLVQTEVIGNKILTTLSQPYKLDTYDYQSTSSIGATLIDGHKQTIDELLKQADIAMYQSKSSGRNSLQFFDPQMQARINARVELEADLRNALTENQFQLFYQPQIHQNHHLIGAEVLIRWFHPQRGLVSPADFIPVAEESGLILSIGHWALETACEQIKNWADSIKTQHLQLAVNVSARQFRQPDFVEQVCQILFQTSINPNRLKLELTESLLLDDIDDTILKMHLLREVGVRFSMDDFGTGYSSLSSLKKLPIDQLKIDQSFVRDIAVDPDDAVIIQTIIAMANKLSMEVIAEGVETESQRSFLEQHGCLLYQGYLFSKPVPLAEFERLVKQS